MSYAENRYRIKVRNALRGIEPICKCDSCENELFIGAHVFKIDGDTFCEDCFDSYVKDNIEHELTEDDIEEPDWEELE